MKTKYKKEEIIKIVNKSNSYRDVVEKLGLVKCGGNVAHIKKIIIEYKICIKHFTKNGSYNHMILEERFWLRVNKKENHECWEWMGSVNKSGYGNIKYKNEIQGAHRISYLIHNGNLDKNLLVLHKCNNKKCVNPNHLYQGTHHDNIIDMIESNRGTQWNKVAQEKRKKSLKKYYKNKNT